MVKNVMIFITGLVVGCILTGLGFIALLTPELEAYRALKEESLRHRIKELQFRKMLMNQDPGRDAAPSLDVRGLRGILNTLPEGGEKMREESDELPKEDK